MSNFKQLILSDNPTHYWKFDETSGDAIDEVGSLNGTLNGDITRGVSGRDGTAYLFDGDAENQYVNFGQAITNGQSVYSVMVWFTWNGGGGGSQERPFLMETDPNWAISLSIRASTSRFEAFINQSDDGSHSLVSEQIMQPGRRYVAHVTYQQGGDLALYINGRYDSEITAPNVSLADTTNLNIGTYRSANNRWWNGWIDEIAIFDYVLTPQQIASQAESLFFERVQDSLITQLNAPSLNGVVYGLEVFLSWGSITDAQYYNLQREVWTGEASPDESANWELDQNFTEVIATHYNDTVPEPGWYRYRVKAFNDNANFLDSDWSEWFQAEFKRLNSLLSIFGDIRAPVYNSSGQRVNIFLSNGTRL
jgi:hypothetical protein